ncbi:MULTISPECIES: cell wall metabolism sensor histidine kinase WalK [unclassified Flavobacterium]|uniref:sensor histidine kinase n=1 Tax=unclassified Flavobacterium TaxID=196869 RepID=UPI001291D083|nr:MULTISPECIES: HAMP domain-containing sensor histidine kinase [unclassified Flavobacterium]MQP52231.1 HAMP domain-containing protein [Flavobacterium sp. LMO9]MQP62301.1 HAMP domain-containing protein [Flavobacterium sp. LMO6]
MFSFSFKNRIAFNYIVSGAILIAIVFLFIYYIVNYSVNNHVNEEIQDELLKHLNDVYIDSNDTYLIHVDQWRAREHNTININPVFVEYYDNNKELIDKSPNLKSSNLKLFNNKNDVFIDTKLNNIPIRQIQTAIINKGKIVGYLVVAMSLEDFEIVLILKNILLITFPLILILLFLIARFFAGRSILPVRTIIETSSKITKDNLQTRIPLPENKDELFVLSENINNLLNRVENAIEREKQFTSDASHELRTPLAVIKGTMEVLIRKPRNQQEYEEKIAFCITEVDRLNHMVDQLLLLARFENQKQNIKKETIFLNAIILDNLTRFSNKIDEKKIKVITHFENEFYLVSDNYLISIIISNLISNAVKYSNYQSEISISLTNTSNEVLFSITDNGIGISATDIDKIFNSFYRSDVSNHSEIKGTGLGLSIVKRLCDLLKIKIHLESELDKGTNFILSFPLDNLK